MIIRAINPPVDDYERGFLAVPVSEAATSLNIKNNERFAANDRVMIGAPGQEKTEIATVASVSGNDVIITAALKFAHETDAPVYVLQFDQVEIYISTTGVDGAYSLLDTVTLDVDNPDLQTKYDHQTGVASNFYKFRFKHSIDSYFSDYSDPIPGGGFGRKTVGFIIGSLLKEFGDINEELVTRDELVEWMNECSDDLQTRARRPYNFLKTRIALTKTANTYYIDEPVDDDTGEYLVWKFDRIDYNKIDTTTDPDTDQTYILRYLFAEAFRDKYPDNTVDATTVSDNVRHYTYEPAMHRFYFRPPFETTQAAALYLYYWGYFARLQGDADEIQTPNSLVYKQYLRMRFFLKRADSDASYRGRAEAEENKYNTEVAKMQQVNRKDAGSPRSFHPDLRRSRGLRKY